MTKNELEILLAVTGGGLLQNWLLRRELKRLWEATFAKRNAELQRLTQRQALAELAAQQAEQRARSLPRESRRDG